MTFSAPIIAPIVRQARRVGDRARRHDRALTGHQPRHRGDRAEAARVGQRDVRRPQDRPRSACSCAPSRPARRRRRGSPSKGSRPASRITGTISVREPSFFSTSTARPRFTCAVVDAVRLAVDLREVVGHHRHVIRRARDRIRDQMRERDLPPRRLQLAPAGVQVRSPSASGSSSPSGSTSDSLHVARERRRAALDRLRARGRCAVGHGRRSPRPGRCSCLPCQRCPRRCPSRRASSTSALTIRPAGPLPDTLADPRPRRLPRARPPATRVCRQPALACAVAWGAAPARRACCGCGASAGGACPGAAPAGASLAITWPDRHRVALLREYLAHRAARRRRQLDVDLVGRDLHDRVVGLDESPDLDVPFEDRSLGDRLARSRGHDIYRLHRRGARRHALFHSSVSAGGARRWVYAE